MCPPNRDVTVSAIQKCHSRLRSGAGRARSLGVAQRPTDVRARGPLKPHPLFFAGERQRVRLVEEPGRRMLTLHQSRPEPRGGSTLSISAFHGLCNSLRNAFSLYRALALRARLSETSPVGQTGTMFLPVVSAPGSQTAQPTLNRRASR